jgi:membrane protein YqaA with SNARE-associated domain
MLQKLSEALLAWGPWGVLLLGFIDSAGIPVATGMDALIILIGIERPAEAHFAALMAVVGSVGGNISLFLAARRGGRRFANADSGKRAHRFRLWFYRYGLVTVFIPALLPIPLPLKVFVISAGALRVPLATFVTVILLARVPRYFGEAYLAVQLGKESTRYLKEHAWHLLAFAAALFLFLMLCLKLVAKYRRPSEELGIRPPET